jgi:nucleotide-binding universal stress UspA family protein
MTMADTAIVWVAEGTWPACIDAARAWVPERTEIVLLHVSGGEVAAAQGALAGLLGRGRRGDPEQEIDVLSAGVAAELLDRAVERLGRPATTRHRTGRVEREVVSAADGASLLVCARDGDRSRLGPRSLGPATRFVVDHASCPVLLVWPGDAPGVDSLPPPPPPGAAPPPPPPPPHER